MYLNNVSYKCILIKLQNKMKVKLHEYTRV